MSRRDLGAEHNTCEACGDPIPATGGTAILTSDTGCAPLALPPPRFCTGSECRAARDRAAMAAAERGGVIACDPCTTLTCSAIGVWPDGTCDRHHEDQHD